MNEQFLPHQILSHTLSHIIQKKYDVSLILFAFRIFFFPHDTNLISTSERLYLFDHYSSSYNTLRTLFSFSESDLDIFFSRSH